MKRSVLCLLAWTTSLHAASVVSSMSDVQYWVGSGANSAVIILDWQDGKGLPGQTGSPPLGQAVAWGVHWSAGQSFTGYDALLALDAADPRLQLSFKFFSGSPFLFGAYYDLNGDGGSVTFDPTGEQGSASDPADHFAEGIRINGFWGYLNGATTGGNLPAWQESGSGAKSRLLTDGSWDAWVFSTDLAAFTSPDPVAAVSAAPEPRAALLLAAGLFGLFTRRKSRR
jgi:hypothetical protein